MVVILPLESANTTPFNTKSYQINTASYTAVRQLLYLHGYGIVVTRDLLKTEQQLKITVLKTWLRLQPHFRKEAQLDRHQLCSTNKYTVMCR
jgi:hypothetical protein